MSMIDPEGMMFTTDWKRLEEIFVREANKAGYFGLDVYNFHIEVKCEPAIKTSFIDSIPAIE